MVKQAVILAAGAGKRLGLSYPKALLSFGNKTILERAIHILYKECIREVIIVTGYKDDELCLFASKMERILAGLRIVRVYNDQYDKTNNIYSLWLARSLFNIGGFVLLNCDVMFHSAILRLLLKSGHETAIAVDDSKELEWEDMKVKLGNKGCVNKISKEIDPKEAQGEYIGLAKFGVNSLSLISQTLDNMVKQGGLSVFYENAIQMICGEVDIYGMSTERFPWIEIDTPEDIEEARTSIYPKLDAIA